MTSSDSRRAVVRAATVTAARGACVAVVAVAAEAAVHRTGRVDREGVWLLASVVLAAVVVALRGPIDRLADRLAYGADGDPHAQLSGFMQRISDTLAVDDVLPRVAQTVTQATHSDSSDVRLWLGDGAEVREVWPPAADPEGAAVVDVPLRHHGDQVGVLGVATERPAATRASSKELLDRLAGTAGLALSNVRLTYDLRRRLDESRELAGHLARSRGRLLAAEREQTERFSRLVAQRVAQPLRQVEPCLDSAATGEPSAITAAVRTVTSALEALRDIAAGVHPPTLADNGLRVALETWAMRAGGRVALTCSGPERRLTDEAEAAAYWCAVALAEEALAVGDDVAVDLALGPDEATVAVRTVRDPSAGTVQLVEDRVEATGGVVDVSPPASAGAGPATVFARWPMEAPA